MTSPQSSARHDVPMEQHPDVKALRARFDQIAPTAATSILRGLAFLAAVYAAISPWVVGFQHTALAIDMLVVGCAAGVLAFALGVAYERLRDWEWVPALCGVWMIISPWAVHGVHRTTGMVVSTVIVGAVLAVLGAAIAGLGLARRRRGPATT